MEERITPIIELSSQEFWNHYRWLPFRPPGDFWFHTVITVPVFAFPIYTNFVYLLYFLQHHWWWPLGPVTQSSRCGIFCKPSTVPSLIPPSSHPTEGSPCDLCTHRNFSDALIFSAALHPQAQKTSLLLNSQITMNYSELITNLSYYSHHAIPSLHLTLLIFFLSSTSSQKPSKEN